MSKNNLIPILGGIILLGIILWGASISQPEPKPQVINTSSSSTSSSIQITDTPEKDQIEARLITQDPQAISGSAQSIPAPIDGGEEVTPGQIASQQEFKQKLSSLTEGFEHECLQKSTEAWDYYDAGDTTDAINAYADAQLGCGATETYTNSLITQYQGFVPDTYLSAAQDLILAAYYIYESSSTSNATALSEIGESEAYDTQVVTFLDSSD